MLDTFRNLIKGWLGKALIALFITPFALFGVSSIFESAGVDDSVVSVNGNDIGTQELRRAIDLQRQRIVSRFGDQYPKDLLSVESLRPNVLEGMIYRELLIQYADDNGHYIGLEGVHKEIRESASFQRDGVFSEVLFQQLLRRANMSVGGFFEELRKDKKGDQIRGGYFGTEFATSVEIDQLVKLNDQKRDISYLQIPLLKVKGQIDVTEQEIEQYFEKNRESYKIPEQVALEYIELKKEGFETGISVTDEEIEAQFAIRIASLEESQTRDASHILLEIGDEQDADQAKSLAQDIHQQILDGADFAVLAKQYSSDTGSAEKGGSLGFAGRGAYLEAFEKALFDLDVDAISEPVLTEFGYHIIKLNGVAPALPELDSIRESLMAEVKSNKAEQPYIDKVEALRDEAFGSQDIEWPAEFLNAEIKHTGYISRAGGGAGIGANKGVITAAFSADVLIDKRNSEVIEIADENKVVVIRVKDHKPESFKELDTVRVQIQLAIESEKSKLKVIALGEELLAKVQAGEFDAKDIEDLDIQWIDKKLIKRNEADIPREVALKAFTLPHSSEQKAIADGVSLNNGDYVLIRLDAVVNGSMDESDTDNTAEKKQQMALALGQEKGQSNFQNVTTWLRDSADIDGI